MKKKFGKSKTSKSVKFRESYSYITKKPFSFFVRVKIFKEIMRNVFDGIKKEKKFLAKSKGVRCQSRFDMERPYYKRLFFYNVVLINF